MVYKFPDILDFKIRLPGISCISNKMKNATVDTFYSCTCVPSAEFSLQCTGRSKNATHFGPLLVGEVGDIMMEASTYGCMLPSLHPHFSVIFFNITEAPNENIVQNHLNITLFNAF